MYLLVKKVHLTLVLLSIILFYFSFFKKQILRKEISNWLRLGRHSIDTLLLISAIVLCVIIGQYPLTVSWLTYKVLFVVGYIGFAFVAMKAADKKQAVLFLSISSICLVLAAKFAVTKGQF